MDGYESSIGPIGKLLCLWQIQKTLQHMHGNIPFMFDYWADPTVHLLLLDTSSMAKYNKVFLDCSWKYVFEDIYSYLWDNKIRLLLNRY